MRVSAALFEECNEFIMGSELSTVIFMRSLSGLTQAWHGRVLTERQAFAILLPRCVRASDPVGPQDHHRAAHLPCVIYESVPPSAVLVQLSSSV